MINLPLFGLCLCWTIKKLVINTKSINLQGTNLRSLKIKIRNKKKYFQARSSFHSFLSFVRFNYRPPLNMYYKLWFVCTYLNPKKRATYQKKTFPEPIKNMWNDCILELHIVIWQKKIISILHKAKEINSSFELN